MNDGVEEFWQQFCAASGTAPATRHDVVEYEHAGDPIPVVGTLSVVLDGSGTPRCVLRTTDVRVAR